MYALYAPLLLGINQRTKFEMSSFTNSKDMIWAKFKKNGSRDHDHTALLGGGAVCHQKVTT